MEVPCPLFKGERMIKKIICVGSIVFSVEAMNVSDSCPPHMVKVVPLLKCLMPEEMASYIRAYKKHFTSVFQLLNTQDKEGNTLLHVLLKETDNVALFDFLYTQNASIDIKNKYGLTVRRLLAMRSSDEFTKVIIAPTLP